jgi:uncharacterized zinc-type alcohol dehydrogenase-like protein
MPTIRAFAADKPGATLKPFEYDPGPLGPEQVDVRVLSCGLCHSDLSMLGNDWGMTAYPFVPGHEVVGVVEAAGPGVKRVRVGDTVGLGWYSASCLSCPRCLAGDHNLCPSAEQTIVGRYGGFADRVRCHWVWATPIPAGVDPTSAGPMFCGGITVFNPIVQFGVCPTDRVGVIGIGGLGHLALAFLSKWGCDVTAFTSSAGKRDEAISLGARRAVSSRDAGEIKALAGSLDFILCTANASLDWDAIIAALAPKGRLHFVGVIPEAIPVQAFPLIAAQRSISGSPLGSPATTSQMLEFAARHKIAPIVEKFPMSRVNDALDRLRSGKARYRVVLEADARG